MIDYDFLGCFASGKSKLIIFKEDKRIMAKLEQPGQRRRLVRLSPLQVDTFNMFIQQLKTRDLKGFCTTQEHYTVKLKDEVIDKTDGSCDWNGFDKLVKCLFDIHN